ncbi:MAG: ATP-binding cassette domain-containing protein [Actinobacteria bacterium]|nr:ATP-binding cassette domain-containing protein [Actinomycetota bacterium]
MADAPAVVVENLEKAFGETKALDGIDLQISEGTILGLLGPNGAGKTTAVRVLATLLHPDSGHAEIFGYDVVRQPAEVRTLIGLAGQNAAVDELLTGRQNLRMVGRLYHMPASEVRSRSEELLERFELTDAAKRAVRTYSGGMRRRLDLAASLLNRPRILYLDEPTTGLDPRSRADVWQMIRALVHEGTTLLLTTQYLEEADRLADQISVIDNGKVIAEGTADELKSSTGGQVVEVRVTRAADLDRAVAVLSSIGDAEAARTDDQVATVAAERGVASVADAAEALRREQLDVTDLALRRPTLDDVFLDITGRVADETPSSNGDRPSGGRGRRGERRKARQ